MTNALFAMLSVIVVLAGCSSEDARDPAAADRRGTITSSDGTMSVEAGTWVEQEAPAPVVLTLQDAENESRQLIATPFDDARQAEDQAVYLATGLASSDIACERTTLGGRVAIDCPFAVEGVDYRKVFVVLDHDGAALLLFQTPSSSRDAAFADLSNVLDGGRWDDGTAW